MSANPHREAYRPWWRLLAQAMVAAAADPAEDPIKLGELARTRRHARWTSPTDDKAGIFLCDAAGSLADAFAQSPTIRRRTALADLVRGAGEILGDLLDATDPAQAAAPAATSPAGRAPGQRLKLWYAGGDD